MKLDLPTVATLLRTELRMILRDRRTVITSIVLPLIVMPIMLFSSSWTTKKREQTLRRATYHYAVTGSQSNAVRSLVAATRERLAAGTNANAGSFKFEEKALTNAIAALNRGEIQFVLEGLTVDEARPGGDVGAAESRPGDERASRRTVSAAGAGTANEADPREAMVAGAPVVRLVFRADRDDSSTGMRRMSGALEETRRIQQGGLLAERKFPILPAQVAAVSDVNLASKGQVAGLTLGKIMTVFLLLFILSSGAVVATDTLAGEKERGTLETLLTTSAGRGEIVTAKHLAILAVALVITLIQIANLLVYVGFKLIPASGDFAAAVPPSVAILLFVLFLPLVALLASVLLLTSGYAKTYREAQFYFLPILLLGAVPALAPFLPDLPLRSAIVIVPIANIAVAAREILIGSFDWPMIGVSWLVTAAAALWTMRVNARFLSAEKLIAAVETDVAEFKRGPALFERRVLAWFVVVWGVVVIVNNFTSTSDIRVQLAVNLVAILFGSSLLMLRRYRLDPRKALALRAPKPVVWLGVLVAVPGGMLTGIGLFKLANLFIPVPPKMLEGFSENVFPADIPFVQLLCFLSLMPGFFEEISFRGLLLHGLRRRLHPVALPIVVGVVFSLFHFSLFRLVPTAFLGVLLAAVTMLTGSIFPAMLWHAFNNALGVLAAKQEIALTELDSWSYVSGAVMLAVAFWIFWRNRTPYPELRPWRPTAGSA